jgi:hypothetical protein
MRLGSSSLERSTQIGSACMLAHLASSCACPPGRQIQEVRRSKKARFVHGTVLHVRFIAVATLQLARPALGASPPAPAWASSLDFDNMMCNQYLRGAYQQHAAWTALCTTQARERGLGETSPRDPGDKRLYSVGESSTIMVRLVWGWAARCFSLLTARGMRRIPSEE